MLTVLDAVIDSIRRCLTTEVLTVLLHHPAAKARVTPMMRLGVSVREESVVTELRSQLLHVLIVVEVTWLNALLLLVECPRCVQIV